MRYQKYQDFKKKLLENPEFKKECERRDLAREIARLVIKARIIKGVTQEKLAKMVGTKQPGIARLENGSSLPSFSLLDKIAKAFKTHINIDFDFIQSIEEQKSKNTGDVTFKVYVITQTMQPNYYFDPMSQLISTNSLNKSYFLPN